MPGKAGGFAEFGVNFDADNIEGAPAVGHRLGQLGRRSESVEFAEFGTCTSEQCEYVADAIAGGGEQAEADEQEDVLDWVRAVVGRAGVEVLGLVVGVEEVVWLQAVVGVPAAFGVVLAAEVLQFVQDAVLLGRGAGEQQDAVFVAVVRPRRRGS
ncbi:hypothetical protein GCM10017567_86450 [Amycolatopsis bullii]|uniref:Uncharacterized protein n=1 Tax=Amycolatopsis bullii TaxID=941987 RepID=A0ABQ3KV23_9PSEU|nr:hypothetical protein GCM10017567_86450 [Amycolatopsis bullii]